LGCGSQGPKNTVSGKVTLKGDPVAGSVVFIGSDNKEVMTHINPDGTYSVPDPAMGENKVLVKGGAVGGPAPPVLEGTPKDFKGTMPPTTTTKMGVAPPPKYGSPDNGLSFKVTGGAQKYDIELTP